MGGIGSGCWDRQSKKDIWEAHPRLSVSSLHRQRLLEGYTNTIQSWTCGGEVVASVRTICHSDYLELFYLWRDDDSDSNPIRVKVPLVETACHFGGARKWFLCPTCLRRIGVLVLVEKTWGCRTCSKLHYACQQESEWQRAQRRILKIQKQLGNVDIACSIEPWLPRPHRMRYATYLRIVTKAEKPLQVIEDRLEKYGLIDFLGRPTQALGEARTAKSPKSSI
jgi:hypothetical protein